MRNYTHKRWRHYKMNIYLFVKEHTEENKTKTTKFYLPNQGPNKWQDTCYK
jgi:hypothetical protein